MSAQYSAQLIQITEFEGKLVVTVPHTTVWSRTVAQRILPFNPLSKPTLVEVQAVLYDDLTQPIEGLYLKAWVRFLKDACRDDVEVLELPLANDESGLDGDPMSDTEVRWSCMEQALTRLGQQLRSIVEECSEAQAARGCAWWFFDFTVSRSHGSLPAPRPRGIHDCSTASGDAALQPRALAEAHGQQ